MMNPKNDGDQTKLTEQTEFLLLLDLLWLVIVETEAEVEYMTLKRAPRGTRLKTA